MAEWRKSSFSGENTNCVEVAGGAERVRVRDSKNPAAPHLAFPTIDWRTSLLAVTPPSHRQQDN
jgi:hypothetical protein